MNRRQASLYLADVPQLESMRANYNPAQFQLILAHVTLCREDEVEDWDILRERLESLCPFEITLGFDAPVRNDDFVFLPVGEGLQSFHEFRKALLTHEPRVQNPHVTIIHPRNGICTDQIFEEISQCIFPFQRTFRDVMLIEQIDGGIWHIISSIGKK